MLGRFTDSLDSPAGTRELTLRFTDLREAVESHFSFEEEDGYFRSALSEAPWLATDAGRLLREHHRLLGELEQLERMLVPERRIGTRREFRVSFAVFRRRLERHENRENRLLQRAYYRDVEAAD